jgi:DNA repair ATPase RecN
MGDHILSTATYDIEQAEGYLREVAVFPNETEAKQVKDDLCERQQQIHHVESYQKQIEDIKERIAECIKQAGEYDRVYQQYGAPFEEDVKED